MPIQITNKLSAQFPPATQTAYPLALFMNAFWDWKAQCAVGVHDSSFLFGKDGAYISPPVNGQPYVLKHVHLIPLIDAHAAEKWRLAYQRRRRRVSNRVLIYAEDPVNGFLLIDILPEPTAHDVAKMATPQYRTAMRAYAAAADAFIFNNKVTL